MTTVNSKNTFFSVAVSNSLRAAWLISLIMAPALPMTLPFSSQTYPLYGRDVASVARFAQLTKELSLPARRISCTYLLPSLSIVLEKQISIRSATAGKSRKTLRGRRLGCTPARAERVMDDIEDIIALCLIEVNKNGPPFLRDLAILQSHIGNC